MFFKLRSHRPHEEAALTQGPGALIRAAEAGQARRPRIVIAPVFAEAIPDDHSGRVATDRVYLVPRMIETSAEKYNPPPIPISSRRSLKTATA